MSHLPPPLGRLGIGGLMLLRLNPDPQLTQSLLHLRTGQNATRNSTLIVRVPKSTELRENLVELLALVALLIRSNRRWIGRKKTPSRPLRVISR